MDDERGNVVLRADADALDQAGEHYVAFFACFPDRVDPVEGSVEVLADDPGAAQSRHIAFDLGIRGAGETALEALLFHERHLLLRRYRSVAVHIDADFSFHPMSVPSRAAVRRPSARPRAFLFGMILSQM